MKREFAPIVGERVRLRLLKESDLPLTLRWRNQPHIRKWFIYSDELTPEQHQLWYENYRTRDNDFTFVIEDISGNPVGQIALYHLDWEAGIAELGRLMIGEPSASGKGLAKAATQVLLEFAFGQLNLKRVVLEVYEDNAPAIAIYEKCGFQRAAQRGRLVMMSLTAP